MAYALTTEWHSTVVPIPDCTEFPASQRTIPQTSTEKAMSSLGGRTKGRTQGADLCSLTHMVSPPCAPLDHTLAHTASHTLSLCFVFLVLFNTHTHTRTHTHTHTHTHRTWRLAWQRFWRRPPWADWASPSLSNTPGGYGARRKQQGARGKQQGAQASSRGHRAAAGGTGQQQGARGSSRGHRAAAGAGHGAAAAGRPAAAGRGEGGGRRAEKGGGGLRLRRCLEAARTYCSLHCGAQHSRHPRRRTAPNHQHTKPPPKVGSSVR